MPNGKLLHFQPTKAVRNKKWGGGPWRLITYNRLNIKLSQFNLRIGAYKYKEVWLFLNLKNGSLQFVMVVLIQTRILQRQCSHKFRPF